MTTFLLIRHAAHDWLGHELVGRRDGVPINAAGVQQSIALASKLRACGVTALYSSPLQRALETARLIGESCALPVRVEPAFNELDFGTWTGRTFPELGPDPAWQKWNAHRAEAEAPGGETMRAVQERALSGLQKLSARHPGECVAIISHGDVLKAIFAAALGKSLDEWPAIDADPAGVSLLRYDAGRLDLVLQNDDGSRVPAAAGLSAGG